MQHPHPSEYKPFAAHYISLVPSGNFKDLLHQNTIDALDFFKNVSTDKEDYSYAAGKWTLKEVLMHIADTERVMSYRALIGIRGDSQAIMWDMNQDLYAGNVDVTGRTMTDLLEEFTAIRTASIKLFENATDIQSRHKVQMNDGTTFTVRAFGYIIIGHVLHHINIAKERYL